MERYRVVALTELVVAAAICRRAPGWAGVLAGSGAWLFVHGGRGS